MNNSFIRKFYDNNFYGGSEKSYAIEQLKQTTRLETIKRLISRESKTLVIGCGAGKDLSLLKEQTVGIDLSLSALLIAKENGCSKPLIVADACNLPFKYDYFECIICSEVLEHIPESEKAVSEASRVLSKGGTMIVTVPNWYSSWGLIRNFAEFLTRKPVTAADQPIDNWFTPHRLYKLLSPSFKINTIRGIWYLPPHGKGNNRIPDVLVYPIYKLLAKSVDRWLGESLPFAGHMIAVKGKNRYSSNAISLNNTQIQG